MNLDHIFGNNKKWIAGKLKIDKDYFNNLSKEQTPEILYIGCSDSRVTAEELMGVQPGEAFIHRNVANLVNYMDLNVQTVINFAVRFLKVNHVVVCGHYDCGGVKAAMLPNDKDILNPWLRNIRDVFRMHNDELKAIKDPKAQYDRLVELNVQEQCVNLLKTAPIQDAIIERNIQIHGWVFDIHTGKLIDLHIDFNKILENILSVYKP